MRRREFLRSGAAAATAFAGASVLSGLPFPRLTFAGRTPGPRIGRIDLFPVIYPTVGYFKFFAGPRGSTGRPAVVVKVTADDGAVGWGQSVPLPKWSYETVETATIVLRDYYAPALIGGDPTDIDRAHAQMDKAIAPGFSTGMPISRAAIDLALHDLAGKLRGKPVAALWGKPAGGKIILSWTVNVTRLDGVGPLVAEGKKRGYLHFNIKVAPDPAFDIALAREVRRLAPETFLCADANGGYEPETAIEAARRLADAGVDVLESPLRPNRISGYQALKKLGALPILMDEGLVSPTDLEEFSRLGMLDGAAMKPARCGGLVSCRRQIEMCVERGMIWLGSGLTDPDISLAASLCLFGAYGLKKPAALNGPQFLAGDVLKTPLRIADGIAHVPDGPGLGVEVDEAKVVALMKQSGGDQLIKS
jgi:L-alanine-DL-glutamate epimerase-like enolase superfamily enzyme